MGGRHASRPRAPATREPKARGAERPETHAGRASRVRRALSRALSAVLDPTIVLSFDRTGYRVHSAAWDPSDLDVDLAGRVCLVTGANSGLGFASVAGLARLGAEVWLLCRNRGRGREALEELREQTGSRRLHLAVVDVADLGSIRSFAAGFRRERVHLLVNNAAVLPDARQETADGIELTFATNVVGPFLLTQLLVPRLRRASGARVVNVSSGGMYTQRLDLSDWQWRERPFDGVVAYAQTKRAEVILSEIWAHRLAPYGIAVNSMHPGWADTPAVRTSLPRFWSTMRPLLRTPAQGADTILWLAASPRAEGRTGLFWFDREPRATWLLPWAHESDAERHQLWLLCERLCGLRRSGPSGC